MYNAVPEDDIEAARLFRALLVSDKMDKKAVYNTETGWGFDGKSSDAEVSAYVARAYILNWAWSFSRYYWLLVFMEPDQTGGNSLRYKRSVHCPHTGCPVQQRGTEMACRLYDDLLRHGAKGIWMIALHRPDGT
jgi:hypothetical protein